MISDLILHPSPSRTTASNTVNWSKKNLRQRLIALGFSDEEMRYRKGARTILADWTGEEKDLFELVKKKWKAKVITCHEANGGNPEEWKIYNTIYSRTVKDLRKFLNPRNTKPIITFECIICGETFKKKLNNPGILQSKLCSNPKCQKKHRANQMRILRSRRKTTYERICAYELCDVRFFTTNKRKKYCCFKCAKKQIGKNHPRRLYKRLSYQEWKAKQTPERLEELKRRVNENNANHRLNETPEQSEARRAKRRIIWNNYYHRRKAEGRPIVKKEINRVEWLEKKRIEYINKPWIYETLKQLYTRSDGSISQKKIKNRNT